MRNRHPDGSDGSPQGGWAFRYGQEAVAGDKFGLGEVLDTGAMLLGRRTWELFAKIWPGRDDPFSAKMNAMPKVVVSRSMEHATDWQNSAVLRGDLISLALVSAQTVGPAVRLIYTRDTGDGGGVRSSSRPR